MNIAPTLQRLISPLVVSALTAAIVGGAAVMVSAQSADTGPVHACVHKTNGNVRIVDGAGDCKNAENYTAWNREGQQGPAGDDGEDGQQGPRGPEGPQGEPGGDGVLTQACNHGGIPGAVSVEFDDDGLAIIRCERADQDGDDWSPPQDCDDNNAAIHPGAVEASNGIDDDCDGSVDEIGPSVDEDADGSYADGSPADCDDGNPGAFPGAAEVWDGVDNDCDGATDNFPSVSVSGLSATWTEGGTRSVQVLVTGEPGAQVRLVNWFVLAPGNDDFTAVSGGTCDGFPIYAGDSCTINVEWDGALPFPLGSDEHATLRVIWEQVDVNGSAARPQEQFEVALVGDN